MHHQLTFDFDKNIAVLAHNGLKEDKRFKMEIQNLVSIVVLNYLILFSRTSAQETQNQPETTPITNGTEAPGMEGLTSSSTPIERSGHAHVHADPTFNGFWAKKFAWRPRWVKTWQEKKVYVAVWKRMWGPVEVKEWVPVPKPPPGWVKSNPGSYIVKKYPHH